MSYSDDIDDAQAALIDRRIGQAFAFVKDVIDNPQLLDEIPDGSELGFADVPENTYIVTGKTPVGETITIAVGVCVCNETRDLDRGKFWLHAGEQWVCPECGRVYSFDGERIDIAEPDHI